jgi:hypothetical protein
MTAQQDLRASAGKRSRQRPQAIDAVRVGSTEALHSDGKSERIAEVSKAKPAQMVSPGQVFPGTATKQASKDAGGFEGTRVRIA